MNLSYSSFSPVVIHRHLKLKYKKSHVISAQYTPDGIPSISESLTYLKLHTPQQVHLQQMSLSQSQRFTFPQNILQRPSEDSYSGFIDTLHRKSIVKATVTQDEKVIKTVTKDGKEHVIVVPLAIGIIDMLLENDVDVTIKYIKDTTTDANVLESLPTEAKIVLFIIEILFIGGIIQFVLNIVRNGSVGGLPQGAQKFIGMNKELDGDTSSTTTFADVAGVDTAKQELMEIVDFLKNPAKYSQLGAQIPRGILLCGSPGVGKTLLARAVAGEAGVPFFSCSGSDFIELFVGVGASRVRDLFKKAREKAPCIIFIDEIDTIGKQRGSGGPGGGGNDEREQTINQLLTLMDGFEGNLGVIVVAATNRPDILDSALLRPGRFDRRVVVDLPDVRGRSEILAIHTKNKPLGEDVKLNQIARITVGFSGADLFNLCNEAAIYAARLGNTTLIQANFVNALEKITLGEERRTVLITEQKKRVLAYHEGGHALVGLVVNDYDIVRKVSIVPRGMTGGATYFEPLDEHIDMSLVTQEYLENKIMVALGGRIAEEIIFGSNKITTGASGDLQMVNSIAYDMVTLFGFNQSLGVANWDGMDGISDVIFAEMKHIINNMYIKSKYIIKKNIVLLDAIANALIERETLAYEDLLELINGLECPIDFEADTEDTSSIIYDIELIQYNDNDDNDDNLANNTNDNDYDCGYSLNDPNDIAYDIIADTEDNTDE